MELFNIEKIFDEKYYNIFQIKNNTNKEVNFLISAISLKKNDEILDIGCGNGRHLIEFYKSGYKKSVGIDLSKPFINEAIKNNKKIEFINSDFIFYDFKNKKFDKIISFFSSFGYYNDEYNERYIKKVSGLIKKNGIFILDIFNFIYFIKNYKEGAIYKFGKIKNKNEFCSKTLINTSYNTINNKIYKYKMRFYTIPEIKSIVDKCGMRIIKIYGNYKGDDFSFNSKRSIFIIKKIS
ncbi:MAG: class I SAM-dependent methyltransferase [Promethearchaeota archaeon]